MTLRVLVLGAGFGGLELTSSLAETLGSEVAVTLIDKNDSFVFGYAKLDAMYGRSTKDEIHIPYRDIVKPGVTFRQETITAIDPVAKRVTTDAGVHETDVLVVALGADYDLAATPGLAEGGQEFYSVAGAKAAGDLIAAFPGGRVIIGVMTPHYKCPPAPSETAMLMDQALRDKGVRDASSITFLTPMPSPLPISAEAGGAILSRFAELGIDAHCSAKTTHVDPVAKVLHLADGREFPYDLLLAVPVHVAPAVVAASPLAENGWIPVERPTLKTKFADVYAIGDVTSVGTPRAGIFAEGAARIVAQQIVAKVRGGEAERFKGDGQCYIEWGEHQVAEIYVNFLEKEHPFANFSGATADGNANKAAFGSTRRARWFGSAAAD
jgi:sulfide:quinone oxidoreductase